MDDATKKSISDLCQPYSFGVQQDMANLLSDLSDNGISASDFIAHIRQEVFNRRSINLELENNIEAAMAEFKLKNKRCDLCGEQMGLAPVNSVPGDQVGGSFKSIWRCRDVYKCGNEVLSELSVEEESTSRGLGRFYGVQNQNEEVSAPMVLPSFSIRNRRRSPRSRRQENMVRKPAQSDTKKPCGS